MKALRLASKPVTYYDLTRRAVIYMTDQTPASQSMDQTKIFGILGYIIPFLFFLPLVTEAKSNQMARYHANQQLIFLLFIVVGNLLAGVLAFVVIGLLLMPIMTIAYFVFMIMGIINVSNGQMKPLPLIGGFTLIK